MYHRKRYDTLLFVLLLFDWSICTMNTWFKGTVVIISTLPVNILTTFLTLKMLFRLVSCAGVNIFLSFLGTFHEIFVENEFLEPENLSTLSDEVLD